MLAVAWPISERLSLDRSLERMFPAEDPDRLEFERIEERFGVSQFLVFAYRDPELWSSDGSGIDRAMQWRKKIEGIPGVSYALDLSRVDEMLTTLRGPAGFLGALTGAQSKRPLVDSNNTLASRYRELFTGQTHAAQSDLGCSQRRFVNTPSSTASIGSKCPGRVARRACRDGRRRLP